MWEYQQGIPLVGKHPVGTPPMGTPLVEYRFRNTRCERMGGVGFRLLAGTYIRKVHVRDPFCASEKRFGLL